MPVSDIRDYFALRRHVLHAWRFLRQRKGDLGAPFLDVPMRDGGTFRLRATPMDRHVFHRLFARDEYRLDEFAPGSLDTVIDVGAHIGVFAARVAPLARRVLCYEPAPENLELLRRNTARFPNVVIHEAAVSGSSGTAAIHLSRSPVAHSLIAGFAADATRTLAVRCLALEEIFREHAIERCDLLKLDCEGAEFEIIPSIGPDLAKRIERIRLEYHPVPAKVASGWTGAELARDIEARGHRVERIGRPDGRGLIFSRILVPPVGIEPTRPLPGTGF